MLDRVGRPIWSFRGADGRRHDVRTQRLVDTDTCWWSFLLFVMFAFKQDEAE